MSGLGALPPASDCNPEPVTPQGIAYAHAEALARRHGAALVVRAAT
jgi:hypothetical protein